MTRQQVYAMRFPLAVVCAGVVFAGASCTESGESGGFGKPAVKDPGVNVKPEKNPEKGPPDFAGALTLSPKYEGDKVVVSVALKPGFHAYAPGEEIGKPVGLTIKGANGWKGDGEVEKPTGKTKDLGELGKSQVLEGTFALSQKVSGGSGDVECDLEIQICTDNSCDRPRKHALKVPTS
jgi:hypothetical protein